MSQIPDFSVVMPARNEGDKVLHAVESIVRGRTTQFYVEIVVVDDASEDGCCVALATRKNEWQRYKADVRILRLPKWSGVPYARNIGGFFARGKYLFITDSNAMFPANWDLPIRRALGPATVLCAAIADPNSAFVGYGCVLHFPSMGVKWLKNPHIFGGYIPVAPCIATIISANLFRSLGGYDTKMHLYGGPEAEFSVRLWLSGAHILVLPDLVVFHHFRPSSQLAAFLKTFEQVITPNYIRFALLYLDTAMAIPVLKFYAAGHPAQFREMLVRVLSNGVWERREELKRVLKYDFGYFLRRFPMAMR